MFAVFDLDGTLALIEHRVHHIQSGKKKDWDAFFAACVDDLPNHVVIETMNALLVAGWKVEIWSGRSDQVRKETEAWLRRAGIDHTLLTRMRRAGVRQPDVNLKRSWLRSLPEKDRPDVIYDDRKRVVDMWRAEGVPSFQVAPGDFD